MPKIKTTSEKINGWKIVKKHNAPEAEKAKADIRRAVLELLGPEHCHVFDAFAGTGGMYRAVWHEAASYVGCDIKEFCMDDRLAYVADSCRIMRNISLKPYNVFDFDAFGSPWEQVYIMIKRRLVAPGERIAMILTEGQGMKFDMGGMSGALAMVANVMQYGAGMGAEQEQIITRALLRTSARMGTEIEKVWRATGHHSSTIRYIGVVMRGCE